MNFWRGKTAVVTGAGSGIGLQLAMDLMRSGMTVIGLDCCEQKIREMNEQLPENKKQYPGNLVPIRCDVSELDQVRDAFANIEIDHGGVDVIINNAAMGIDGTFSTGSLELLKKVMDTNIFGMVACTNLAIESMRKRMCRGHIFNINSICGHYIPPFSEPKLNMYVVSKHAMTTFTEVLRQELRHLKLNIKVTSVSPGVVATGLFDASKTTVVTRDFVMQNPHLLCEDVSRSVLHALEAPERVQHHEILMHALHEVY